MKQKIREQVGLLSSLNRVQSVLFMHCGSCLVIVIPLKFVFINQNGPSIERNNRYHSKPLITQSNYKLIKLSKELENSSVLEVTGFSFVSGWFRRDQW